MNHIINQSSKRIIAEGEEGSFARIKSQYNITVNELIDFINKIYLQDGIYRHANYSELIWICEETEITDRKIQSDCIKSAYFYSISKNDNYIV